MVFLDLNIPGQIGGDVLGFGKREPNVANVSVIVVTSNHQSEPTQRVKEASADA
jgi:response regulator RpfG family c-di-GMP phosphodiesterase